jgi:hypothetical protein
VDVEVVGDDLHVQEPKDEQRESDDADECEHNQDEARESVGREVSRATWQPSALCGRFGGHPITMVRRKLGERCDAPSCECACELGEDRQVRRGAGPDPGPARGAVAAPIRFLSRPNSRSTAARNSLIPNPACTLTAVVALKDPLSPNGCCAATPLSRGPPWAWRCGLLGRTLRVVIRPALVANPHAVVPGPARVHLSACAGATARSVPLNARCLLSLTTRPLPLASFGWSANEGQTGKTGRYWGSRETEPGVQRSGRRAVLGEREGPCLGLMHL